MRNIREWSTVDDKIYFPMSAQSLVASHPSATQSLRHLPDIAAENWTAITAVGNNHITQTFL